MRDSAGAGITSAFISSTVFITDAALYSPRIFCTLDKVHPGGVVAVVTSKGTMDKENDDIRKYIAQRAELLGAIRLPDTAFKANGIELLCNSSRKVIKLNTMKLAATHTLGHYTKEIADTHCIQGLQ